MLTEENTAPRTLKKGKAFLAMMSAGMVVFVYILFGLNQTALEAHGATVANNKYVTVKGNVKDGNGKPMANVKVSISVQKSVWDKKTKSYKNVWKTAGTAVTDKNGAYSVQALTPATNAIIVKWVRNGTTKPVITQTFKIDKNGKSFAFDLKASKAFAPLATLAFSY
ncbi:carboxypeptidase regulatory-like domain-containing protein [Cohnella endophytica]|uniref:Carboxypeptidase regulatory-like domain-containing protein n=1 Tax=Cohnella endophytica TaxID=2419778 RepID=A0A494XDV6_9BACL|nr:carboxypeptidase-like regulatory domain-containing protein [Cohnella endophytica]RKP46304.1 carboxypeptidase regulatory-like domain-containing protein [Cohnella endophytica]